MSLFANLKFRIFLFNYGVPLLWFTIFLIAYFFPDFPFSNGVALGLAIGSSLRIFMTQRFLLTLETQENNVIITYLTQVMQKKKFVISAEQIHTVLYFKKKWYDPFDKIALKNKKLLKEFYLTATENNEHFIENLSSIRSINNKVQLHIT